MWRTIAPYTLHLLPQRGVIILFFFNLKNISLIISSLLFIWYLKRPIINVVQHFSVTACFYLLVSLPNFHVLTQNAFLWLITFLSVFSKSAHTPFLGTKLRIRYVISHIKKLFSDTFAVCNVFLSQSRDWHLTGTVALVLMHTFCHFQENCLF